MRLAVKHIGLIVGIFSVFVSLLFFGRQHGMYLLISLLGTLTAAICLIWILFGKGAVRLKILWVGIVLLAIAIDLAVAPYLIDTSYRIYLAGHKDVLSDVNKIFAASKGDVWVM